MSKIFDIYWILTHTLLVLGALPAVNKPWIARTSLETASPVAFLPQASTRTSEITFECLFASGTCEKTQIISGDSITSTFSLPKI